MSFDSFMMIATMIVAVALIVVVVVQGQSASSLGSMFGGSDIYRTRRGIEKTLYNTTFLLAGLFLLLSLVTVALE
jgi:preprotein translocase subunit SecG